MGLSFGLIDQNQLSALQVKNIANEVIIEMQANLRVTPSLLISNRPEPTPLGALAYANGKCVLVININQNAWAQWGRFLNRNNQTQWPQIIATSVAHEIGHCLNESREFITQYEISGNELKGLQSTRNSMTQPEIIFKQELFADVVSILYAKKYFGDESGDVINTLIKARERYSSNEPTHNTAKILNRIIKQEITRFENESIGVAAIRILSEL
jgi:hypothetical protein